MKRKAWCLATALLVGCTHVKPPKANRELLGISGGPVELKAQIIEELEKQAPDANIEDASDVWEPLMTGTAEKSFATWPLVLQADWRTATDRCGADPEDPALSFFCAKLVRQVTWNRLLELKHARASTNVTWRPSDRGMVSITLEHIDANAMLEVVMETSAPYSEGVVTTMRLLRAMPYEACNTPYIPTTNIETAIGAANSKDSAYAHVVSCREPKPSLRHSIERGTLDRPPPLSGANARPPTASAPPAQPPPPRIVYNPKLDTTQTPASMGPLILPAACPARPGRLRFRDSVAPSFSVMLVERWLTANASVSGIVDCTLDGENERRAGSGGLPITINTYILTCDKHSVKTSVVTESDGWAERASEKLLTALAAELCP